MSASSLSSLSTPAIGNVSLPASQIPSLVTASASDASTLHREKPGGPALHTPPSQGMAADLLLDKV